MDEQEHKLFPVSGVLLAATILTIVFYLIYSSVTEQKLPEIPPKKRTQDTTKEIPPIPAPSEIVSLRVYPIKSCRGIQLERTTLKPTGLDLDRNWMFIDVGKANKEFLTIRSDSNMTLIDTALSGSGADTQLHISIHGTDDHVTIPAYPTSSWLTANTKLTQVEIWSANTDAYEYGPSINSIFSKYFEKDVALVYKGPEPRNIATNGSPDLYGRKQNHHFADVMSLQVASESSLEDLNRRLKENGQDELTVERFRPNIVIKGGEPWQEDTWKRIRVSPKNVSEKATSLDLDVVARCARCQVPNVDPDTAYKHPKEPWDTLMRFRRVDPGGVAKWKPCFGMLCVPQGESVVEVGDKLEVLETTSKHMYNTARFADL
ncbi:hypothetical protein LTR66_009064 [Elasticomyces elasticus]|nr:hypothetical protein LTR28_004613 [Elasticomyces elasticus]KAK4982854.1 hypothetical protein LTR66_009064 [Elasticomyces elasticus]KAK4986734.1 hypothetical protein LTR50_005112 [Elasticomyces elasticus]